MRNRDSSAVPTQGLTHIALAVSDPKASLEFYRAVLGVVSVYEDASVDPADTE